MSRAKRLRQATLLRRRIVLIEKMFAPKFKAEMVRMAAQAGQDYQDGGLGRVEVGIDEHRKKMEGLLLELYQKSGEVSYRYVNNLYGQKKDGMLEAMTRLAADWFFQSFTLAASIAETSKDYLRQVTKTLVAEGVGEVEMGKKIREVVGGMAPWRSRLIARTESHASVMTSQDSIIKDMELPPHKKEWMSGDARTRKTHKQADGQQVWPNETFTVGGDQLRFPGDRRGSAKEVINCLLPETVVSGVNPMRLFRSNYIGEVFEIHTLGGQKLTVTPNHPIMTKSGFRPARLIKKFDELVVNTGLDNVTPSNLYVKGMHPTVSQLYDSFYETLAPVRVGGGIVNFHGDIAHSDVEIIDIGLPLRDNDEPSILDSLSDSSLKLSDSVRSMLMSDSSFDKFLFASCLPSDGIVSRLDHFFDVLGRSFAESDFISLASISGFKTKVFEAGIDDSPISADFFRHSLNTYPVLVHLFNLFMVLRSFAKESVFEQVSRIEVSHYEGYVYNIEDEKTLYNASGIINHNCRCVVSRVFLDDFEDIDLNS